MRDYWTNKWYSDEKKAKLGVIAAGYPFSMVEIYQEDNHWRFRLNEAGLADRAASLAEAPPMRKLPEHLKLVERKKLALPPERKRIPSA